MLFLDVDDDDDGIVNNNNNNNSRCLSNKSSTFLKR